MLSYALYPYSSSSASSSSSSSSSSFASPLDRFAEWVPECLHPAIAIASDMSYHHHNQEEEEEEEEEEGLDEEEDEEEEEEDDEEEEEELEEGSVTSASSIEGREREAEEDVDEEEGEEEEEIEEVYQRGLDYPRDDHHLVLYSHQYRGSGSGSRSMTCLSCKEVYSRRGAGTCRECYDEASETKEALKKEIDELRAQIAFLKTWSPEAMDEGCADIVLECSEGSKIRAHRAILISRSSVFRAMLESKMEESRTNTIKITDFSHEVLKLFIHYLYTAEIYPESLDDSAFDLLALAEKYHVNQLKSMCERYMISKVNSGNALFNFEYASLHGAKTLKEAALSAIMENIKELSSKSEYKDLVNRDPKLVVEIYEAYLRKQTGKGSIQ